MPGLIVNVLPKRAYNFGNNALGSDQSFVVAERIDISQHNRVALILRVHQLSAAGGTIAFRLYKDGHTRNDPTKDFLQQTAELTLTASTVAPTLISTDQTVEGQFAALVVNGNRTLSSPLTATVSADLVLRSPEDEVILGSAFARPQRPAIVGAMKSPIDLAMCARLLKPLFEPWGLDLGSVRFVVKPLHPQIVAQTLSKDDVALSPGLLEGQNMPSILGVLAHELTHIVQIRKLGFQTAAARAIAEARAHGQGGMREVSDALRRRTPADLDPTDPAFTLEAISNRIGDFGHVVGRLRPREMADLDAI